MESPSRIADPHVVTRWARANQKQRLLASFYTYAKESGIVPDLTPDPYEQVCTYLENVLPDTPGITAWRLATGRIRQKPTLWEQRFFLELLPRLTFKTSLLSALCCFALHLELEYTGRIDIRITLGRATTADAEKTLYGIKTHLSDNPVLSEAFGNLKNRFEKWTDSSIVFRDRTPGLREPTIDTTGLNTSKTGTHPDLVILDDLVNEDNYRSPVIMESARQKIQAFYMVLERWGVMLVVGTRWGDNDVYGWLIQQDEDRVLHGKAEQWGKLIWGAYEKDRVRFPTVLPEWRIEHLRTNLDPKLFSSNILNVCRAEGEDIFTLAYIQYCDVEFHGTPGFAQIYLPERDQNDNLIDCNLSLRRRFGEYIPVHTVMLVDPAPTVQRTIRNKKADFNALVIVAFDDQGNWWVLYAAELKMLPTERLEHMVWLARRFCPHTLALENADLDGVLLQEKLDGLGLRTKVVMFSPTYDRRAITKDPELAPRGQRSKEAQIEATEPMLRARRVFFQRGETQPLIEQLTRYPYIDHDDVLDAFSMGRAYEAHAVADLTTGPADPAERAERWEYEQEGLDWKTGRPLDDPLPAPIGTGPVRRQSAGLLSGESRRGTLVR